MRVVVVGAGIVGTSAALTLAERGIEVVVVERSVVAGEASGLNAGIIGGGGWGHTPDLEVSLKMGSREIFQLLADESDRDIGLDTTGTLTLIRTEEEWDWAAATVAADQAAGRQLELVDQRSLLQLEPAADPELLGAILDPLGARAEPFASTEALAARARRAGAIIRTGVNVTSLHPVTNGWRIGLESGDELGADAVVLAAGPWCAELGALVGVDLPIVPVRGQMWASESQPQLLHHAITAAESPLAWQSEGSLTGEPPNLTHRDGQRATRHLYGRQRPNGEIVFGGDRVKSSGRTIDADGIAINHQHVAELLPSTRTLKPIRTWAGLMPFSLDGQPVIGSIPDRPGLFVAGGLASSGFGRGPMAGRLVADLVSGQEPPVTVPPVALS